MKTERLHALLLETAAEARKRSEHTDTPYVERPRLRALAERLTGEANSLRRLAERNTEIHGVDLQTSFRQALVGAMVLVSFLFVAPALVAQSLPASTGCIGNNVVTVYRPDIAKDTLALAELDAHESVHRAQIRNGMSKGMTCGDALQALSANPLVNLMAEVPAYRAQAEWNKKARGTAFDVSQFYGFVAQALYATYSPSGCRPEVGGGLWCPAGKMPPMPYTYILQYLTTGVRPPWPPQMSDYPQPNVVLADSLLQTGGRVS